VSARITIAANQASVPGVTSGQKLVGGSRSGDAAVPDSLRSAPAESALSSEGAESLWAHPDEPVSTSAAHVRSTNPVLVKVVIPYPL